MIETGRVEVGGVGAFFRRKAGQGPPVVMVHGVPDHSGGWVPFLERLPSPALALDLPGFGRSDRPSPDRFDCSARAYGDFVERALRELGIGRRRLLVHDWGAVGLIAAQRRPEQVTRLCVVNAVPFLPGYRWHRTARIWRTPVLGELATLWCPRPALALGLRESRGDWSRPPAEFVDGIARHLDRGTWRAILRLYRSAPPDELVRLGGSLGGIRAPALVVWSELDRYLPARFGRAYADALPDAELMELPGLGHWPWAEDPRVIDRIVGFLCADDRGAVNQA